MYEKNISKIERIMEILNNTYKRFNFHNSTFILDSSAIYETEFVTFLAAVKTFLNEHNIKFKVINSVVESVKSKFSDDQDDIFNQIVEVELEAFTFLESLNMIEYVSDNLQLSVEDNFINLLKEYSNKENVYFICNNFDFINRLYNEEALSSISENIKIRSIGKYGFLCNMYKYRKFHDTYNFHLDEEELEHYFHNFFFLFREIFITAYIASDPNFKKFMENFLPFFDLYDIKFSVLDFSINNLNKIAALNNEYKERAEYGIELLNRMKAENRLVVYKCDPKYTTIEDVFPTLGYKLRDDSNILVLSNYYKLYETIKGINESNIDNDKFKNIEVCTINEDGLLIDFPTLFNYPDEYNEKEKCLPIEYRLNHKGERNPEKDILNTFYGYKIIHKQILFDYSSLLHPDAEKFLHNLYLYAKYYKVAIHILECNLGYFYEAIDEKSAKFNPNLENVKALYLKLMDEHIFIVHSVPPKNFDYAKQRINSIIPELEEQFMLDANNVYLKSIKKKYSLVYITSDKVLKENALELNKSFKESSIETCEVIDGGFLGNFESC